MAKVKPSPTILQEKIHAREVMRQDLNRAKIVAEQVGSPFWKTIQAKVQRELEATESILDGFESMPPDSRICLLQKRKDYRFFLGIAEDATQSVDYIETKLAKIEAEIEEARERIREN